MPKTRQLLFTASLLLGTACAMNVSAQDDGFDLSSQRGEIKTVNPVPGKKIDHKGIIINPTPQSITRPNTGELNTSGGFKVKDKRKAFADNIGFLDLKPKGIEVVIDFGEKIAAKAGVKPVDGAYHLSIGPKKIMTAARSTVSRLCVRFSPALHAPAELRSP